MRRKQMKNIDWEMVGAFIVIGISIVVGSWAGYKLFKFCTQLFISEFDDDEMFENIFREFEREFEEAFKEEEKRREKRHEEFKSHFNYNYNREKAKQASDGMNLKQACEILGINEKDVKNMKMEDLKKIFRQKAMETHPDKGGSNESFRKTKDAYDFVAAAA
jgi:hypothetical protein